MTREERERASEKAEREMSDGEAHGKRYRDRGGWKRYHAARASTATPTGRHCSATSSSTSRVIKTFRSLERIFFWS